MKEQDRHSDKKVLVIGLDAATFDIARPLMEKGKLPNLSRMCRNGVCGELQTTIPPLSPIAWTTFATGKNAGKHGVFSFTEQRPGNYAIRFVNARSRKARPIWSILSDYGKKVGVINMPITYPPDEIDGFMISGMDAPGRKSPFTYPPHLRDVLLKEFDYEIDYSFLGANLMKRGEKVLKNLYRVEEKRVSAARYLMEAMDWDFFLIVLVALDRTQHFFWHCMEPAHSRYHEEGAEKYRDAVFAMYERMDDLVARLMESTDEQTTVFLMSDHGAGPFEDVVPFLNLNDWLYEEGYLSLKAKQANWKRMLMNSRDFFRKNLPSRTKDWLKAKMPGFREGFQSHVFFSAIKWSGTKAFAAYDEFMARGIRVNLKGREPEGVIEAGEEYERLRTELIHKIGRLCHPVTHEPVVSGVFRREELHSGDFLDMAPDIVIEWNEKAFFTGKKTNKRELSAKKERFELTGILRSGDHRPNGVIMGKGPLIAKAKSISGAHIMDLAPTILYLLDQPVPSDMDGKILYQIFQESFVENNPPRYRTEKKEKNLGAEETYTEKEEKKVEKRLKKLGYLD